MRDRKLFKIILTGLFSAIGIILAFIEIPYIIPWLQFDVSETVVLLGVSTLGLIPMFFISLFKSIAHLFSGSVTPYNIGEITAFIAALTFGLTFYFIKIKNLIIKLILTTIVFTVIMTLCNYLFITPIYFGKFWYTQLEDISYLSSSIKDLPFLKNTEISTYGLSIILLYLPFNLIKGLLVSLVYYFIHPQVSKISKKYL